MMYGSQPQLRMGSQDAFYFSMRNNTSMGFMPQNAKGPYANEIFESNPTMLLHQHNMCKQDNRDRLKDCKNLADLVNFKVKTLADQFQTDRAPQLQTETSINALKKMCDPLLANRVYPKLMAKKATDYSIPESWKTPYNNAPFPKITKVTNSSMERITGIATQVNSMQDYFEDELGESFRKKKEKFLQDQQALQIASQNLKTQHEQSVVSQDDRLRKSALDRQQDPVKMLKGFFDGKEEEKKSRKSRSEMGHYSVPQKVHPNYVIAKYAKMKESGMLDKIDKLIDQRNSQQELIDQYQYYVQLQHLSNHMNESQFTNDNNAPLLNQDSMESNFRLNIQDQPVKRMKAELKQIFNEDEENSNDEVTMPVINSPQALLDRVDSILKNNQNQYQSKTSNKIDHDKIQKRLDTAIMMPKLKNQDNSITLIRPMKIVDSISQNQKPSEIPGGMVHSELLKYQIVKENLNNKAYVSYTPEQIELVTRLKNMEAKQCNANKKAKTRDSSAKRLQRKLMQEMIQNRKISKQQEDSYIGSMTVNPRGSLPQIKNELERGKNAFSGKKSYQEDDLHFKPQILGYKKNSDYTISQYGPRPDRSQQGTKSQQYNRNKGNFQKSNRTGAEETMNTSNLAPSRIAAQGITKKIVAKTNNNGSDYYQVNTIKNMGIQAAKSSIPSESISNYDNTQTHGDMHQKFAKTEGFNAKIISNEECPAIMSDTVPPEQSEPKAQKSRQSIQDEETITEEIQNNNIRGRISIYSNQQNSRTNILIKNASKEKIHAKNAKSISVIDQTPQNNGQSPLEKNLGETEYILFQAADTKKPEVNSAKNDQILEAQVETQSYTELLSPLPDKEPEPKPKLEVAKSINIQLQELSATDRLSTIKSKKTLIGSQLRKKPEPIETEKGYHSSVEPPMDQFSAEMYDVIIKEHLIRRGCWIPSRFKKFPRFTIFTQKDLTFDKEHLINQYISLNPEVLALLAASDFDNINKINMVLGEPAVTHTSVLEKATSPLKNPKRSSPHSTFVNSIQNESQKIGNSELINQDVLELVQEPKIDMINETGSINFTTAEFPEIEGSKLTKQFDPFDKILLTRGIDNQILTSFRTLSKKNNMISNTLKVVHKNFQASKSKLTKKQLYDLNREIYDPISQMSLENMTRQEREEFASYFAMISTLQRQQTKSPLGKDLSTDAPKQWMLDDSVTPPEYQTNFRISSSSGFQNEVKIPILQMNNADIGEQNIITTENTRTREGSIMNKTFNLGKKKGSIDDNFQTTDRELIVFGVNAIPVDQQTTVTKTGMDDWPIQEKIQIDVIKGRNVKGKNTSYEDSVMISNRQKKHQVVINTHYGSMGGGTEVAPSSKVNQSTEMPITETHIQIKNQQNEITPIDEGIDEFGVKLQKQYLKESVYLDELNNKLNKQPKKVKFTGGFNKKLSQRKPIVKDPSGVTPSMLKQDEVIQLMEVITQQNTKFSQEDIKTMIQKKSFVGGSDKGQIKKIINDIYQREKKYEKKILERQDFVASKDLIFDLSRANELDLITEPKEQEFASGTVHKKIVLQQPSAKLSSSKQKNGHVKLSSVAPASESLKAEPIVTDYLEAKMPIRRRDTKNSLNNSTVNSLQGEEKDNFIVGMQIIKRKMQ